MLLVVSDNQVKLLMQRAMTGRAGFDRKAVGSTAEQLRLRDCMLADLRAQNKVLAGVQPIASRGTIAHAPSHTFARSSPCLQCTLGMLLALPVAKQHQPQSSVAEPTSALQHQCLMLP